MRGIQHLVAAAVPGLDPVAVTVVDGHGAALSQAPELPPLSSEADVYAYGLDGTSLLSERLVALAADSSRQMSTASYLEASIVVGD